MKIKSTFLLVFCITLFSCDNQERSTEKLNAQQFCADYVYIYANKLSKKIQDEMFETCIKSKGY